MRGGLLALISSTRRHRRNRLHVTSAASPLVNEIIISRRPKGSYVTYRLTTLVEAKRM